MVAGAVLGALVVCGGAYQLASGGHHAAAGTFDASWAASTRLLSDSGDAAAASVLPPAVAQVQGRNPFKALYVAPVAGGPGAPGATPVPVPTTPIGTPTGTPTAAPTTPASPSPSPTKAAPYKITLNAVGPLLGGVRTMSWTVDGVIGNVLVGQRFGRGGELVVLTIKTAKGAQQAVLQIGNAAPRSIGIGATIEVR